MKKVLIICASGMSSSLIAKKVKNYFTSNNKDIIVEATPAKLGTGRIADNDYDLYLISPQTKMFSKKFGEMATKKNKPIIDLPAEYYLPVPACIEKIGEFILETFEEM